MKRTELIITIQNIFSTALETKQKKSEAQSASFAAREFEQSISQFDKTLAKFDDTVINAMNEARQGILKSMTAAMNLKSKEAQEAVEKYSPEALTELYSKAVRNFTELGHTGFYDTGIILTLDRESDNDPVLSMIARLQSEGVDVQIVDQCTLASQCRNYGYIGLIMPSSDIATFEEALKVIYDGSDVLSESEKRIRTDAFFLPPFINGEIENDAKQVKDTIAWHRAKNDDKSDFTDIRIGFTGIAYRYVEMRSLGRSLSEQLADAIKHTLATVDLYSTSPSEHVNGQMPTTLCYEDAEIEQANISMAAFTNGMKPLNIADDIKRFKEI